MELPHQTVRIKWLGGTPNTNFGTSFGLPWPQARLRPGKAIFTCWANTGRKVSLQTWITGYWPDGSIKWTAHALPRDTLPEEAYRVTASSQPGLVVLPEPSYSPIRVTYSAETIDVQNGAISATFATSGKFVLTRITGKSGTCLAENGHLILISEDLAGTDSKEYTTSSPINQLESVIDKVEVTQETHLRVLVTVRGTHRHSSQARASKPTSTEMCLPFILRFYLYAGSEVIRIVHTVVYDGNPNSAKIRGIGLRFDVLLHTTNVFDRHIRFAKSNGQCFSEAVQGLTGLWKDPGAGVRAAQIEGKQTPPMEQWDEDFVNHLKWVPKWSDFSLAQLSPDGFTIKKRTKAGYAWVSTSGGGRAEGLAFVGSHHGGLAVGLRDFWERYPTSFDIRGATKESAEITLWLYSPLGEPMDVRPYHDGLGQRTYDEQLDALKMTYEDWEDGLSSAHGVARTNEIFIAGLESTPSAEAFAELARWVRSPPVLSAEPEYLRSTLAFGNLWSPVSQNVPENIVKLEANLEFLFKFYHNQVSQRRWYGFWDHGDLMHTYDGDRHVWRYDIGGYAWDNSELSPDLWLWLYFLRTGREDVYRLAESLTRHTGEVDVYHIGPLKGVGTRHGVQHWSDSCKQMRVSNALYRRIFYFLTGGDERVGELLDETLEAGDTFLILDPYRKVRTDRESYKPRAEAVSISLGTDWTGLVSSWFIDWERHGQNWKESLERIVASTKGIGALKNGFVTGTVSYNHETSDILPPPIDQLNRGIVKVSHLSAMFGLIEICSELLLAFGKEVPEGFEGAWLDYCRFYNAPEEEQVGRFGHAFGKLILRQGHSRLTAFAANYLADQDLSLRAWSEFYTGDGYSPALPWTSIVVHEGSVGERVEESSWISTNITSLYSLAAIQLLALTRSENTHL